MLKTRPAKEVVIRVPNAIGTLNEIASEHGVHPNLLMQGKKQLLDSLPAVFADKRVKDNKEQEAHEALLYQQIGQLKVELDWLKKKVGHLNRSETPAGRAGASRL